ncbi:MAG: rhodanese-like domain-containing protein [Gammaproteobacteria bacterium]|nr:rhodanese-like domain-containing protein [Gammaproteobacteria bacterium]
MNPTTRAPVVSYVDATSLQGMLGDKKEMALLDVREAAAFAVGHLWLATNLPLSRLELRIRRFIPRAQTRIVLCDDDDGVAERASATLAKMGYDNLHILRGGIQAWSRAGYSLIDGNYVIAHSFGSFIEEHYQTPVITADELIAKLNACEDTVVIDTRAESEHAANSLPNSISVPAAEVVHRIPDLAPDPTTQVVVHCAGITRAALGAQGLLNCAIANPVFSLRDGTRGWVLAGGELANNQTIARADISPTAKEFAANAAKQLARRFNLTYFTPEQLIQWRRENPHRTCYLIDVRSGQEYLDGHYPDAISIPGGELAGMTIDHLATRHARLGLLADADCARAEITASWMQQLGWSDVVIVRDWKNTQPLVAGPEPDYYPEIEQLNVVTISPSELASQLLLGNMIVIDFSPSEYYRRAHIPDSVWASRSQLSKDFTLPDHIEHIVFTSVSGRLARLAADDLRQHTNLPIKVLNGGNEAWRTAGLEIETGLKQHLGYIDDVDQNFIETPEMDEELMHERYRRNIAWRNGLYRQFKQDQSLRFVMPP